ncbi:hypothetical protein D3C86_1351580 [compost metagenome]
MLDDTFFDTAEVNRTQHVRNQVTARVDQYPTIEEDIAPGGVIDVLDNVFHVTWLEGTCPVMVDERDLVSPHAFQHFPMELRSRALTG